MRLFSQNKFAKSCARFRKTSSRNRALVFSKQVQEIADGRVFTGRMAQKKGLIDAIGSEFQARVWLADFKGIDKSLPVRDIVVKPKLKDWLEHILLLPQKIAFTDGLRLDGLLSVWHPKLN